MVYTIPLPSTCIDRAVSITSNACFVLRFWKSIIVNFILIHQSSIYILSISCINRSMMSIGFIHNLPSSSLYSLSSNTFSSDNSVLTLTHPLTQCKSWSSNSSYFMKTCICSILLTIVNSLLVIFIPMGPSLLYF